MLPVFGVVWLPSLPFWGYALLITLVLLGGSLSHLRWGRAASLFFTALLLALVWLLLKDLPQEAVAVNAFGVIVSAAFLLGFSCFVFYGRRVGLDPRESSEIALASVVVGLLCARLGFLLLHQEGLGLQNLQLFSEGLSATTGLAGGALYAWWFAARRGASPSLLAQPAALALLLAFSLGKLGCLLHGCDFGAPTDLFIAINYPAEWPNLVHEGGWLQSPASLYQHSEAFATRFPEWVSQLTAYDDRSQGAPLSLPVHPLPLYEAAGALLLFFMLLWGGIYASKKSQHTARYALLGYATLRFLCDLFRGDNEPLFFSLTFTQWASLLVLLSFVIWRLTLQKRPPTTAP
jgi:prolipoprotein diacylglyceryltransferase